MQPQETHEWQQHIEVLQTETDKNLVDAAVLALTPLIEEMAMRVCRRRMVSKQLFLDFVANAVTEVTAPRESRNGIRRTPRVAEYNFADGKLESWLMKVLDHLLIDQLKSTGRRAARETANSSMSDDMPVAEPSDGGKQNVHFVVGLDRESPFSMSDVARLEEWPVLDRILVLAIFGLSQKLPQATWQSWCQEASLPTPLPVEPHIPLNRGDWINHIAKLVVASPKALHNRVRRRLEQLKTNPLDYIREIRYDK